MKKLWIVLGLSGTLLSACSGGGAKSVQDTTPALNQTGNDNQNPTDTMGANAGAKPSATVYQKGKDLMATADCMTCHKEQDKLVGPSFASIAAKYPADDKNTDYLAGKIIAGGSGVWGDVAMTPHPAISKGDAKEMVKYILSVK
jgi:cytochrome c